MLNDFELCIKTLLFASDLIGCNHDIVVNTNVFRKNCTQHDFDNNSKLNPDDDIYIIEANPKITISSVIDLFEHIESQFNALRGPLVTFSDSFILFDHVDSLRKKLSGPSVAYISSFNFNKKLNRYFIKLVSCEDIDGHYSSGGYAPLHVLKFAKSVLDLEQNILFNSGIHDHLFSDDRKKFNLNKYDDFIGLSGKYNNKISLNDIVDLFIKLFANFTYVHSRGISRSFYFEGIHFNCHIKGIPCWSIRWGS